VHLIFQLGAVLHLNDDGAPCGYHGWEVIVDRRGVPTPIGKLNDCRRLAAVESNSPVIFMTAIDDEATRKAAMKAGCVAYLKSPLRRRESGGLANAPIPRTAALRQD